MFCEICEIGEEVLISVLPENRGWGYNPAPDGTRVKIVGFNEIHYGRTSNLGREPGVYINYSSVNVCLPDGKVIDVPTYHLKPINESEFEQRLIKAKEENQFLRVTRLRDLPNTKFWEEDIVVNKGGNQLFVSSIDYNCIDHKWDNGEPYPYYNVVQTLKHGPYSFATEQELSLVQRGNVWKFHHNEPLIFKDLEEEANFFNRIGQTEEVRNPDTGLYSWTKDEALAAVRSGVIHGFGVGFSLFSGLPRINATRFKNEELGKRVAEATLKGFSE